MVSVYLNTVDRNTGAYENQSLKQHIQKKYVKIQTNCVDI